MSSLSALPGFLMAGWGFQSIFPKSVSGSSDTFPERSGDQLFAEFVIVYGAACPTGNCPNAQKSPVTTVQVVEAPIYRPRPLASLLRKDRRVYAPVIILTAPTPDTKESK